MAKAQTDNGVLRHDGTGRAVFITENPAPGMSIFVMRGYYVDTGRPAFFTKQGHYRMDDKRIEKDLIDEPIAN